MFVDVEAPAILSSFTFKTFTHFGMSQGTSTAFEVMIFLTYSVLMPFPTIFSELAKASFIVLAGWAFKHLFLELF